MRGLGDAEWVRFSLIPKPLRELIGELFHLEAKFIQSTRRDSIRWAADPDGGDGMAAMIKHRCGDAGKRLALLAAIQRVAAGFGLLELGEKSRGAGNCVAGVFGELDLLHKGLLCFRAPVGEYGLCRCGGVQSEGMANLDHDLHRMR